MRLSIAAVHASDWLRLGADRLDRVLSCGIVAVDVRIARLHDGPSATERRLAQLVIDAGLELRCHAWVGHRSGDVAAVDASLGARDGHVAAACASEIKASSFGCNAERDVWRGQGGRAHPKAVDYLDSFANLFHEGTQTAELDYVGFADPRAHYTNVDADGDGDLDAEIPLDLRQRFRSVGVMAYQSTLDAVQRVLARARRRWPEHAEAGRMVPWLGVGREGVGRAPVTAAVAAEYGGACLYVGFGAIGQLVDGNNWHPPIVTLVPQIVDAWRAVA